MCAHILVGARGVAVDVDGVGDHRLGAVLGVLVADPVPAYRFHSISCGVKIAIWVIIYQSTPSYCKLTLCVLALDQHVEGPHMPSCRCTA